MKETKRWKLLNNTITTNRHSYVFALLVLIVLTIYSNTLNSPFVFDDFPNIVNNPSIKKIDYFFDLEKIFEPDIPNSVRYFFLNRYVGYLSFAVNYQINHLDTFGYRFINILIHISNTILVYLIVFAVAKKNLPVFNYNPDFIRFFSFLIALSFAVHPLQTQAVTYIVQRFASLSTFFFLLSFLLYIRFRQNSESKFRLFLYILSLTFYVIAMRTKEIAITLPLIIGLYEISFLNEINKKRIQFILPFFVLSLIIPLTVLSTLGFDEGINAANNTKIEPKNYLLTQFTVIVKYIQLLIFPIEQSLDYVYPIYTSFWNTRVFVSFLVIICIFIISIYCIFIKKQDFFIRFFGFGMLWFFITLSVESSIIPIADPIFEHRLYLPSTGFLVASISIAFSISNSYLNKKTIKFVIIAPFFIVFILALLTYNRNEIYNNEEKIWQDVIKKFPNSIRGYTNLAHTYNKQGQFNKTIDLKYITDSLNIYDFKLEINYFYAYLNKRNFGEAYLILNDLSLKYEDNPNIKKAKGWYFYFLGDRKNAIKYFIASIKEGLMHSDTFLNLAELYKLENQFNLSILFYKNAILYSPNDNKILLMLAENYLKIGEINKAHEIFSKIRNDIELLDETLTSGSILILNSKLNEAKYYFELLQKINPEHPEAYYFLGLTEFKLGNLEEAKSHFYKSLELKTEYIHFAHFFLAKIYQKQGDKKNAIKHIKKSLEAKPDYELAQKTLKDLDSN